MPAPSGYRIYEGSSPAVTAKAVEVLTQDYGYSESAVLDGKDLLFVVETHNWYGANPDKPLAPHKGVTVYERIGGGVTPSSLGRPLMGLAIAGLGYWLWRRG